MTEAVWQKNGTPIRVCVKSVFEDIATIIPDVNLKTGLQVVRVLLLQSHF